MKSKTLTILVAVLVVLAALKYMQTVRHRASLRQTGLESLVADLQATDMGRLVITGPSGKDVVLARSGSDWVLESSFGHPASASNIERLLGSLSGLKGEFRSDKEEVLADYGLDDAQAIRLRVYERGSGETLSCGTGACAAVVAGIRRELLDSPVNVATRGGALTISWDGDDTAVQMTGPAITVFTGEIHI